MPIKIPDNLPAAKTLRSEGVVIIEEHEAMRQDIRPMRIAVLNLMPEKIKTETQLSRLLGATPLQIELTLLTTGSYTPSNTPQDHMLAFYRPWSDVRDQKFDGLIVTGAPVEEMEFDKVAYWSELQAIFDWAKTNVFRSFHICWGAQAALNHYYGVPKYLFEKKLSGVFPHRIHRRSCELLRGFNDVLTIPVSRWTEVRERDIMKHPALEILLSSEEAGLALIRDESLGAVFMFNHLEYDTYTLADEYKRDRQDRPDQARLPDHYFPADDPAKTPANSWRAHGHLLFGNWINEMYQTTPFNLDDISEDKTRRHLG